jgi:hypothetical protein
MLALEANDKKLKLGLGKELLPVLATHYEGEFEDGDRHGKGTITWT